MTGFRAADEYIGYFSRLISGCFCGNAGYPSSSHIEVIIKSPSYNLSDLRKNVLEMYSQ